MFSTTWKVISFCLSCGLIKCGHTKYFLCWYDLNSITKNKFESLISDSITFYFCLSGNLFIIYIIMLVTVAIKGFVPKYSIVIKAIKHIPILYLCIGYILYIEVFKCF